MKLGLTGGIGAGKSTVSRELERLGAYIIDADRLAREIVAPGEAGLELVARHFTGVIKQGELDRAALAKQVFEDDAKRRLLDSLLHPEIKKLAETRAAEYLNKNPGGVVVIDAALLIQAGMHADVDRVWVVVADDETRIERVMLRDGASREQVLARINAQTPQSELVKFADVVIDNSCEREATLRKVKELYKALLRARC